MKQYGSAEEAGGGQHVGYSDDEGSVVLQSTKTPVCAACRTRESKIWWKAPKGLQTNVLCDTCGTNWRKYADLSVRPWREESLPKTKAIEKREGTPLAGPSAKRAKVSCLIDIPGENDLIPYVNLSKIPPFLFIVPLDFHIGTIYTTTSTTGECSTDSMRSVSQIRFAWEGTSMQAMRSPRSCRCVTRNPLEERLNEFIHSLFRFLRCIS